MKTIIPISVEEANTDILAKISEVMSGKFNATMQIELYQGRSDDFEDSVSPPSPICEEIHTIFQLLGKSGQPHFILSIRPKAAP